jgi:hypothetical protein
MTVEGAGRQLEWSLMVANQVRGPWFFFGVVLSVVMQGMGVGQGRASIQLSLWHLRAALHFLVAG